MNLFSRLRICAPIGLCIATAGAAAWADTPPSSCPAPTSGGEQQQQQQSPTPQQSAEQPSLPSMFELVGDALQKVCLSADQQAKVDTIGKEVAPQEKKLSEARRAFVNALADQFPSGTIDESALKDKTDAYVKAREEASPVLREAIESLHDILDKGQRAAFADALQGRMKDFTDSAKSWADQFAHDLDLTGEQKDRIKDVLARAKPEIDKEQAQAQSALDAFRGTDFSIEEIAPADEVGDRMREVTKGMIHLAEQMAPILTPEQRAEVTKKIEAVSSEKAAPRPVKPLQILGVGGFGWGNGLGWGNSYYSGFGPYGSYFGSPGFVTSGYTSGFPFVSGYAPGIW